jgi:hypothetical protein
MLNLRGCVPFLVSARVSLAIHSNLPLKLLKIWLERESKPANDVLLRYVMYCK